MNKYLVSVDIEGITGVSSKLFSEVNGNSYGLARDLMVEDTNAVVEGIISADPNAYVLVRDAHGNATNIDIRRLHPSAYLLQGWGDLMNMLDGLDSSYKGIFLVGYHAGGQNNEAVLAHTFSSLIHHIKVNDKIVNEAGLAGIYAGYYGVPVAFISGDNHTIAAAKQQFENIVGVMVKESSSRDAATSMPLNRTRMLLRDGASQAVYDLQQDLLKPLQISTPLQIEIKFYNIAYGISVYQKLYKILDFDKNYNFIPEQFIISYIARDQLEFIRRLTLMFNLIYGVKSQ